VSDRCGSHAPLFLRAPPLTTIIRRALPIDRHRLHPTAALPLLLSLALVAASPVSATGQITDTLPAPVSPPSATPPLVVDTVGGPLITIPPRAPISPRSAFFRSLLLPGYGQIGLDRSVAAGVYALTEAVAVGMARKSVLDLREAKRAPIDSTVASYRRDPATGQPLTDPETGQFIPESFVFNDLGGRVRARRTHLEDWIAVLIFNHLFSAADAFVAAHLWDFPAQVGASVVPGREARITASIPW
jgi:hypothetical protein